MGFLNGLMGNKSLQETLINQLAEKFKEQGISQVVITIKEGGKVEFETVTEDQIIVSQKEYEYLKAEWKKQIKP